MGLSEAGGCQIAVCVGTNIREGALHTSEWVEARLTRRGAGEWQTIGGKRVHGGDRCCSREDAWLKRIFPLGKI